MTLVEKQRLQNGLIAMAQLLKLTRESEYLCGDFLRDVAEYHQTLKLGGKLDSRLEHVAHHIATCGECREEFEALQRSDSIIQ